MGSPKAEKNAKEKKARKKRKSPETAHAPAHQEKTPSPETETTSSGFTPPMQNHEKSNKEQSHLQEGPEYNGLSMTAPTYEGVKGITRNSAKRVSREIDDSIAKDAVKHAAKDAAKDVAEDTDKLAVEVAVHDAFRRDNIPATGKNAPVRLEPETKPQEERSLSSIANLCPPSSYEQITPFALLSIGGRRSSAGHYRSAEAALMFRRQSVLLIVAASAVGCIMLALVVSKLLQNAHEIDLACISNECRKWRPATGGMSLATNPSTIQVAEYINSVVDASVRPCDDFYRHVCGRWLRADVAPSSFAADAARNFSDVRHAQLSLERDDGVAERSASLLYRSCLDFYGHALNLAAVADSLFKELNLSAAAWLKETAPEALFADSVRISFVHGFHSLFEVASWNAGGEMHYAVDVQPSFTQRVGGDRARAEGLRRYLASVLEAIVGKGNVSGAIFDEVVALDRDRARKQYNDAPKRAKMDELVCGRFSGPMWADALSRHVAAKVNGASVETRRFDAVCHDLDVVLVQTTSAARPLYLLVLIMAHVVRYDYRLSGPKRTADLLRESCYEETSGVFGSAWPPLLTRLLSVSQSSQKAIDAYFRTMLKGSIKQVFSREWMTRVDALAATKMLENVSMLRFPAGTPSELCGWDRENNASSILTPTDFIRKKVALQNRDNGGGTNCDRAPGSDRRARLLHLLDGTAMTIERATRTLVVPHAFGLPPLYYPQLQEEYASLAVVGVQMALRILGITFASHTDDSGENETHPWSQETLARYKKMQNCYALQFPASHGPLADHQFELASVAPDAVQLAHSEKARLDPAAGSWQRRRATSALFFRRVCLALCKSAEAPGDAHGGDEATLHAACLLGVASVPRFYEVFACAEDDRMTHMRECFDD
ncbi:uncharacterized protein [Dermacentor albipictus]|uniref:uncharacterized protein isoform X3 n=1 Tax=Dermacentor albipictus TaxID=60249 RepID=UPI0031FCA3A1